LIDPKAADTHSAGQLGLIEAEPEPTIPYQGTEVSRCSNYCASHVCDRLPLTK
jgi:hypothetical protein